MSKLELWAQSHPQKLLIRTFVDSPASTSTKSLCKVTTGKISEDDIREAIGNPTNSSKTVVLVCGPESCVQELSSFAHPLFNRLCSMIDALSGPKDRDGSQGAIGGILGKLPGDFKVWKL